MSRFSGYWASQCGNPRGIVGSIVTWAMNRTNKVMYNTYMNILQNMPMPDYAFSAKGCENHD